MTTADVLDSVREAGIDADDSTDLDAEGFVEDPVEIAASIEAELWDAHMNRIEQAMMARGEL